MFTRQQTHSVQVGAIRIGGGAPVAVQSMTNTDTADANATAAQAVQLIEAGAELVRFTVNTEAAARAVPEIAARLRDAGRLVPLIGDFHYNGEKLLQTVPECARVLDKYRINPGNVGRGDKHDTAFDTICRIAAEHGKAVRIGVNAGSLDPDLVEREMAGNRAAGHERPPDTVMNDCMILSAIQSTEAAIRAGLGEDRIVISCKTSCPALLMDLYRKLAARIRQPLHLGLTEAGLGIKGVVWSVAPMAVLLEQGIGDTIRVSLTPGPKGDRRDEVYMACELLQSLGLRRFAPAVVSCPGCGRTSGTTFQALAQEVQDYVRTRLPQWRERHTGVEALTFAVMGCVVNGPGESKHATIGISLPGAGESPRCPVYVEGEKRTVLTGDVRQLARDFETIIEDYIAGLPCKS